MKYLVFGLGFLGSTIFSVSSKLGINIVGTHLTKNQPIVDICDINAIEKMISQYKPDVVYNCAALTNVDEIELNPKKAYEVNAYGARNIAMVSSKFNLKLIHVSTDSVFDGNGSLYSELDKPNPINEYAKSKLLGENLVKQNTSDYVIVRTNFYGCHKENKFFFNWILQNLKKGDKINAFYDVVFNPLEVSELAKMLLELGSSDFKGLIHLSADEVYSKYQFAVKTAEVLGFNGDLVNKTSINQANLIARRPLNTSLNNLLSKKILKFRPRKFEKWLMDSKHTLI